MIVLWAAQAALLALATVLFSSPELLARIAGGDASALRAVYDLHAGKVYALALRILRQPAEAEDIVQETFLALWRQASEFDRERGELSAWVMSMARSRCIDRLRRARVRTRYAESAKAEDDDATTPEDGAADSERGALVRRLLASLPEQQRVALQLAYFAGLTQEQIAARMDTPLGTVKTRLRLALEKLAKELEGAP